MFVKRRKWHYAIADTRRGRSEDDTPDVSTISVFRLSPKLDPARHYLTVHKFQQAHVHVYYNYIKYSRLKFQNQLHPLQHTATHLQRVHQRGVWARPEGLVAWLQSCMDHDPPQALVLLSTLSTDKLRNIF